MALELLEDEKMATFFVTLRGELRDRWLERKAGVEVREIGWERLEDNRVVD